MISWLHHVSFFALISAVPECKVISRLRYITFPHESHEELLVKELAHKVTFVPGDELVTITLCSV